MDLQHKRNTGFRNKYGEFIHSESLTEGEEVYIGQKSE